MPRIVMYSNLDLKPGADANALEAMGKLASEHFRDISGCLEAMLLIGDRADDSDYPNQRVG